MKPPRSKRPSRREHHDVRLAIDALRQIVQRLRASAGAAERRAGLTGAQIFVLRQLGASPRISVNELAARTFSDQSSVSIVVQRLVSRGLVAKVPAPDDRRRLQLTVTDRGRATLRRAPRVAQEALLDAIVRLRPQICRVFAAALSDIAETIGRATHSAAPMLFEPRRARERKRPPRRKGS